MNNYKKIIIRNTKVLKLLKKEVKEKGNYEGIFGVDIICDIKKFKGNKFRKERRIRRKDTNVYFLNENAYKLVNETVSFNEKFNLNN